MRLALELEDSIVRIVFECDDEEQAERGFERLNAQLATGTITFSLTDIHGGIPTLEVSR